MQCAVEIYCLEEKQDFEGIDDHKTNCLYLPLFVKGLNKMSL